MHEERKHEERKHKGRVHEERQHETRQLRTHSNTPWVPTDPDRIQIKRLEARLPHAWYFSLLDVLFDPEDRAECVQGPWTNPTITYFALFRLMLPRTIWRIFTVMQIDATASGGPETDIKRMSTSKKEAHMRGITFCYRYDVIPRIALNVFKDRETSINYIFRFVLAYASQNE